MRRMVLCVLMLVMVIAVFGDEPVAIRQADKITYDGVQLKTPDGNIIAFWTDTLSGTPRIMAQSFGSSGFSNWAHSMPVVSGFAEPLALSACMASDGKYLLLAAEYVDQQLTLRMQKINTNGNVLWGESGVQVNEQDYMNWSPLVADAQGGGYVFWHNSMDFNVIYGQHLNSSGAPQWDAGGMEVMTHTQLLLPEEACSDGSGGVILNIKKSMGAGVTESHLLRLSPTGSSVGNNPLLPSTAFPGSQYHIVASEAGEYILYNADPSQVVRFLRIDASGAILAPLVEYALPSNSVPGAGVFVTITPGTGLYYTYITNAPCVYYTCRLDSSLAQMWPADVALTPDDGADCNGLSLDAGSDARLWAAWARSEYPAGVQDIRCQMIEPSGQPALDADGMLLSTTLKVAMYPSAAAFSNGGHFFWTQSRAGLASLCCQNVSIQGALQWPQGGAALRECIAGFAGAEDVVAMQDQFCMLWSDTRDNDLGNVYYQITDASMNPLLAPNGVRLGDGTSVNDRLVKALPMPDGSVAVLYNNIVAYDIAGDLVLQQILPDGSKLYPHPGIVISAGHGSAKASLGVFEGNIYIAWVDNVFESQTYYTRIIGQRINNGQVEWGGGGHLMFEQSDTNVSELMVNGPFILWEYNYFGSIDCIVRALRVLQNGSPAPGWPLTGLDVVSSASNWVSLSGSKSGLAGNDLVCTFKRESSEYTGLFAQRFSTYGQRVWGSNGIQLDEDIFSSVSCVDIADETTFGIYNYTIDGLWLKRYSATGSPLLGEQGAQINVPGDYYNDVLVRYPDGWYSFFRTNNAPGGWKDILHQYISPSGTPQFTQPQVICGAPFNQEYLRAARIDNTASLLWRDDRMGIYDNENFLSSVYAVRVVSEHVDTDDPGMNTPALPSITGIGPNPFRSSATISFNLPRATDVDVAIYNIKGQKVTALSMIKTYPAGIHSIVWNGRDQSGIPVASGVYLCVLKAEGSVSRRSMVLVK